MSDIHKCGFCGLLAGFLRRIMCSGNRRGSSESCYRELGDQDALRFDGRSEASSDSTPSLQEIFDSDVIEVPVEKPMERRTFLEEMYLIIQEDAKEGNIMNWNRRGPTGLFHSFRVKRGRGSFASATKDEEVVLDNCYPMHVQLLLSRSSSWNFDTTNLDRATGGRCLPILCMHLFTGYGLIDFFKLLPESCWKLFRSIEDCYHGTNPYHNSVHAADVTQAIHCFLQEPPLSRYLSQLEVMVVLLAAITHDLDHPGVNHSFLVATDHPLAIMYKDHELESEDWSPPPSRAKKGTTCESLLEHHHWRAAYSVILESGIFNHMSERLPEIQRMLRSLILATDITRQNEYLTVFKDHLKHNTLDMELPDHRHMVLQMALKTADISNPGRPWAISRKWSHSVCDEFYQQGDKEMKLKLKVSNLCDRQKDTVPKIQTGFFRFVVTPLFTEWHHYLKSDLSRTMLTNLVHNEAEWAREDRRSSQTSKSHSYLHKTNSDLVEKDLETSYSKSTVSLCTEDMTALIYAESMGRRASHSPVKESKLKEIIRRYSVPLHLGSLKAPSKVSLILELTVMMATLAAKRGADAEAKTADADAGPSKAEVAPPLDVDEPLIDLSTPRRVLLGYAVQLDSDDDDNLSSDGKGGRGIASVIIEESNLPSGAGVSSASPRRSLLSAQTASAFNSEGHLQQLDDATREKGRCPPTRRRGSAPAAGVGALAVQRLASELSQQLHRTKHSASCHQWVAAEAPAGGGAARRGSLPVEVMAGISA